MTFINLLFSPLSFILVSIAGALVCGIKSIATKEKQTRNACLAVFFVVAGIFQVALIMDMEPTYDQQTDRFSNETPEQAEFRRAMEQLQREANRI